MADAQHIAAEFLGRYKIERKPLPAIALTNLSAITAIGNDYGFDKIFERQVDAFAQKGDVVIGFTTSGMSQNVINGFLKAKEKKAKTICLTGRAKLDVDVLINVDSDDTPTVQENHIAIGHKICEIVEKHYGEL